MSTTFTCQHCHSQHDWPGYCEGKVVTCPTCRRKFLASTVSGKEETLPADVPATAKPLLTELVGEPVPYAVLNEEVEPVNQEGSQRSRAEPPPSGTRRKRNATTGQSIDLAQNIHDLCERRDLQHLLPARRLVYALLVTELETLRPNVLITIITTILLPFIVLFTLGLGFMLMLAVHLVSVFLDHLGLGSFPGLLYLVPSFVIVLGIVMKRSARDEPISLARNDRNKVERFKLGRLDIIFRASDPTTTLFFLGVLLSSQAGLLYFLPDHLGVTHTGTLAECALLSLDNFLQGILLGTLETFNLHLAHKVEHSFWSGLVFYGFRLGYDGFAILAAFQLWRHFSMRRLFRHLPRHWRNIDFVVDWIDHATRKEDKWAREFLDEFLFLVLAAGYLSGNDDRLRDINHRFPWLRIDEEVRKLFVDDKGQRLFER